ncbi:MAG TPA: hypothetical protein VF713_09390, partial [Thermoanaerobaculia bacterium]
VCGHDRITYLGSDPRGLAEMLLQEGRELLNESHKEDELLSVRELKFLDSVGDLVRTPETDLRFFASTLKDTLMHWLLALRHARQLKTSTSLDYLSGLMDTARDALRRLVETIQILRTHVVDANMEALVDALSDLCELQQLTGKLLYARSNPHDPETIRSSIELHLTSLATLVDQFTRLRMQVSETDIEYTGSFFELGAGGAADDPHTGRRLVVMMPTQTLWQVFENVVVSNPRKHVLPYADRRRVRVQVDIEGLTSFNGRLTIATRVFVDDTPKVFGGTLFGGTLGYQNTLVHVHGGSIAPLLTSEHDVIGVAIDVIAGYF